MKSSSSCNAIQAMASQGPKYDRAIRRDKRIVSKAGVIRRDRRTIRKPNFL